MLSSSALISDNTVDTVGSSNIACAGCALATLNFFVLGQVTPLEPDEAKLAGTMRPARVVVVGGGGKGEFARANPKVAEAIQCSR